MHRSVSFALAVGLHSRRTLTYTPNFEPFEYVQFELFYWSSGLTNERSEVERRKKKKNDGSNSDDDDDDSDWEQIVSEKCTQN